MDKTITTVSLIQSIAKANFCSTSGANAIKFNAGYGFEGTHPLGKAFGIIIIIEKNT